MRLNKPKEYKKEVFLMNEWNGFIFTKDSQVFEQSIFFFANEYLLSFASTSPLSLQGLQEELEVMLGSLDIKKEE